MEDVSSTLAATVAVDGVSRSTWLVVADGLVAWIWTFLVRSTIHMPVRVHLLPQTMVQLR